LNDQAWYPCVFETTTGPGHVMMGGPLISNAGTQPFQMMFRLPLPVRKGNLRLHVAGCRIGLLGADPGNFVSQLSVNGMTHLAMKVMYESTEAVSAQQLKEYSMAPHDCSNYEAVLVRVWCKVNAPSKLHVTSVSLNCYYA